jgi:hypothetical protein
MPVYNDSDNIPPFLPAGDYVFCVVDFDIKISTGGKTSGSEMYEMELEIEPHTNKVRENLIDHPACAWKLDTFLKCSGVKLTKGEAFEFRKDVAESKGVRWINPIGLRGWCRVGTQPGSKDPTKTFNNITTFYTDKEKLPAREMPEEECPF